jgi:hypothetical protein
VYGGSEAVDLVLESKGLHFFGFREGKLIN